MNLETFPLDQNASLHSVQVKITEELKIAGTDQLLLLRSGEVPKATGKLLQQIREIPPREEESKVNGDSRQKIKIENRVVM